MSKSDIDKGVLQLAEIVDFIDVRPVAFLARHTGPDPGLGAKLQLELKANVAIHRNEQVSNQFDARGVFEVRAHREAAKAEPFVQIQYEVVARYSFPKGEFSDEVLTRFAQSNGMIHLWPYFRSFVSTSLGQLGLTPFALPLWRVKNAKWGPEEERGSERRDSSAPAKR